MVFLVIMPLGEASTKKISVGAPVFIGETDLDITSALDNCRIISWWPEGADTSQPAGKTITLRALNEISPAMSHYTISPGEYGNSTGTWYCAERKPLKTVFVVQDPKVAIRVWDLNNNTDVSGTTVPMTANVTYRIETNLDTALQLKYRPELNPADSFWTVKLTDPTGNGITNIFTGTYGAADTIILTLDSNPLITSSPYLWRSGSDWNRASRSAQGGLIYPPGTYTFTVSQNLNGMPGEYQSAGITDTDGKLTNSAKITFASAAGVTSIPTAEITTETTEVANIPETTVTETVPPIDEPEMPTPVPEKTTYAPLPGWIVLAGLGIAAVFAARQRR
jgi:hypothetical protein